MLYNLARIYSQSFSHHIGSSTLKINVFPCKYSRGSQYNQGVHFIIMAPRATKNGRNSSCVDDTDELF